ncbi:MAG: tRNA (guanosine(46)-N7)-methyltransferase TrmB [Synergistaceae bacterium]|nr:tRNA (guanosine(46)-N7)-methyltransferase TrmB [Synergistaceae bacterium]
MYWNFGDIIRGPLDAKFSRRDGELSVEIGFGNGEHLAHLARTRPDSLVVGIEVSRWCVTKAARRALSLGLENIRLIYGDARFLLARMFEPSSVSRICMNFPCPWPKKRHSARRVARPEFAGLIAFCLARDGEFTLATDVEWYAEETREIFAETADFETGRIIVNGERDYATKYERKWQAMGRDIYTVTARRTGPETNDARNGEEPDGLGPIDAPACPHGLRERVTPLAGEILKGHGYVVIFRDVFFSGAGDALVTAISVDEGFEQHYHIKLMPTRNGVRCALDTIGRPYITPGVRASVRYTVRRIAGELQEKP